ncbi:hypothetical protein B0H34DRAFT_789745 [Crassisporium funariophilum]|nr:hypothetical protein B0H34DRAFT_789745 [Crassisporium funariophilum]
MSAGGYDSPHMPSSFSRYDSRRLSGNMPASYDRPPPTMPRRRSPSPGPSRRPFNSYVPHRSELPSRDAGPNVYRPNNYRPDYAGTYYSRSPSPDPYGPSMRVSDPETWDRPSSWRPPPPVKTASAWPEIKPVPPSPTTSSARGRGSRDDTTSSRLFEPSDSWKQTHVDRPLRVDTSPISDRHNDRRMRGGIDRSPDRPNRTNLTPAFIPGGDRYRPGPPKRDSNPPGRSDYDSYRPPYENSWSPAGSHSRRDSGSVTYTRTSDRFDDSPYSARHLSRKNSVSPPRVPSPVHSPISTTWGAPEHENVPWSYPRALDTAHRDVPLKPATRPPSRSSIASTHVSDRKSPPTFVPRPEGKVEMKPEPTTRVVASSHGVISKAESLPKTNVVEPQSDKAINGSIKTSDALAAYPSPVSKASDVSVIRENIRDPIAQRPALTTTIEKEAVSLPKPTVNGKVALKSKKTVTATSSQRSSSKTLPASQQPETVPRPQRHKTSLISQPEHANLPSNPRLLCELKDVPMDVDVAQVTEPPPNPVSASQPIIDGTPTLPSTQQGMSVDVHVPQLSESKSMEDSLRIVVMMRLLRDRQPRDTIIDPVIMANLSIASRPEAHPAATPEKLLNKMFTGQALKERTESFAATKPFLAMFFEQRQAMISDKITRLREEYLSLHERWVLSCTALNEQQKTLASEHEMQHTGRTTRRTTAITDAVRSDFEMEQIIASLGNDDATDPNHLSMRNLAKIPDMISVTNGKVDYVFDDTSHLVDNPSEYFAPHTGIHDWTEMEKQVFIGKFAEYPKQFGIIADFLPNKTASQCVDFYYLHKKQHIDFRKVVSQFAPNKRRRRGMGKKKGNGLLADIALHDAEVHRGSGSASPSVVGRAPRGRKTMGAPKVTASAARRNAVQFEDTPTSTPTPEPESRPRRRKVAATSTISAVTVAATAITVAPTAPTTTSISAPPIVQSVSAATVDENETPEQESEPRPVKRAKRTRKTIKSAATIPDDPPSPGPEERAKDSTEPSSRTKKVVAPPVIQWEEEDKNLFLSLLAQYGDDFKRIAASMPNKTTIQVSNYYKSNLILLDLEKVARSAPKRSPTPVHRDARKEHPGIVSPTSASGPTSPTMAPNVTPPVLPFFFGSAENQHPPSSAPAYPERRISSDGMHYPPQPPWSAQHSASKPRGSYLSPPISRPNHHATPEIRRPSLYGMAPRGVSYPYPPNPDSRNHEPQHDGDMRSGPHSPQAQMRQMPPYPPNRYGRSMSGSYGSPSHGTTPSMSPPMRPPYLYPTTHGNSNQAHHQQGGAWPPSGRSYEPRQGYPNYPPPRSYSPEEPQHPPSRRLSDAGNNLRRENPYPVFSNMGDINSSSAAASSASPSPSNSSNTPGVSYLHPPLWNT